MDKLVSLDSSGRNQLDYVISYFFQLYLILHTCIRKFDVTGTAQIFLGTKRSLTLLLCLMHINGIKCQTWFLEKLKGKQVK